LRIGKVSKRQAETVRGHVEKLVASQITGHAPSDETSRWVAELPDSLADKLAGVGLIPNRVKEPAKETRTDTLGEFLATYIASRAILKPNTQRNYETTRRHLVDHFGDERQLSSITPGDADEIREALRRRLSAATVSREIKRARQFFRAALRKRLIDENPFSDLPTPAQVNDDREFNVKPEIVAKVLEACPDSQWRLIVALSRYGGLRCPSEHLSLTWGDIDWEHDRITVRSPKTEHHTGGGSRVIPMFPELRPHLEAAFDEAEAGTEFVITRYRDTNSNLRTQLLRILRRAGVQPWPKLFHNMRATRQTELTAQFPLHVVCDWLGNSAPIADKHYLQVTDQHYAEATKNPTQNPTQQAAASVRTDSQTKTATPEKTRELPLFAARCEAVREQGVPPRGVEPLLPD
jgi:integrase